MWIFIRANLIPLANSIPIPIPHASPKPISSQPTPLDASQSILPMALQPPRQLHASEVSHTNSSTRQCTDNTIHQRAKSQMSTHTRPSTGQLRVRIPPNTELQRQRIANNDPRRRFARDTVSSRSRNRPRRNRLRRRMHKHIHARRNMQMAQLQRSRQRHNHRRVNLAQAALPIRLFGRSLLKLLFQGARR